MIRIPTGRMPKSTARTLSLVFGLATVVVSFFAPQYSELLREVGIGLGALGLTLGKP